MTTSDFPNLIQVVQESWLAAIVRWARNAGQWAATHSLAVRLVTRAWQQGSRWSAADRWRFGAVAVGTAAIGQWLLLQVIPAYVATALPHAMFLGFGLMCFTVAMLAEPWSRALERIRDRTRYRVGDG